MLTGLWLLQGRRMALISSGCLHSMAAANSHMPAWPAPALAARPGRLPLLLWTLTLDRPLVTQLELHWLTTQPEAEQNTPHPETPAAQPPPGACPGISVMCTLFPAPAHCSHVSNLPGACSHYMSAVGTVPGEGMILCRCRHGGEGGLPGPGSSGEGERAGGRQAWRKGLPGAAAHGIQAGWSSGWSWRLRPPPPAQWPVDQGKAMHHAEI